MNTLEKKQVHYTLNIDNFSIEVRVFFREGKC